MENKMEVRGLRKSYGDFALKDLSFGVPKGYVTGFIGGNGAGKTTTIKSMLSLISCQGEVFFGGRSLRNADYLQKIGVVMDEPLLAKDWTMDLVNGAMKIGYDRWSEEIFYSQLLRFRIDRKRRVRELSRGMKIKLMLAIALSHEAELLILDEPTGGLDPSMRDEFTDIIMEFVRDESHTVLFSTHITQDLEAIADYIVFIDAGRLVFFGGKDEFIEEYLVLKGGIAEAERIDKDCILGRKTSAVGTEILLRVEDLGKVEGDFLREKTTLDKIMVLYGREKA
ncbi:MAG: ABC transporter ATP-binding protein [Peptostreptococcaceae bacterium]|nr:ABC transporter ATP-binding protein [Peptostreptococcaceae bacterium]